jgi:hypothetical protein
VRGVGFKTFIEIGREIGTLIHVLRDNDGDYKGNVEQERLEYVDFTNVKLFSSANDLEFSLEPALIYANSINENKLDAFAKIILSTTTYNKYIKQKSLKEKQDNLIEWFRSEKGNGKGARKVDSAIRLFDCELDFKYPLFLEEAFNFA